MADLFDTLELVKRLDGGSDVSLADLRDWIKIPDGWTQSSSVDGKPVDEVLTLNIDETSIDDLASTIQEIDSRIEDIRRARSTIEPFGVWLRAQLHGETYARQSYVLSGKRSNQIRVSSPAMLSNTLMQYTLGLTRMAAWEDNEPLTIVAGTAGSVSAHGGKIAYSIPGDLNARIALTKIIPSDGASTFDEFWIGVKSELYGGVTPSNFVSFWGFDKRGNTGVTGDDTSASSDATAVSGVNLATTFSAAPGLAYRIVVPANLVTANVNDQRGRYVVLLRCKSSNSSLVVNVRAGSGYNYPGALYSFSHGELLQLSNFATGWNYYALGEFDLPPISGVYDLDMHYAAIALEAEKVSGSGNLIMDGFLLIPAEHFIHIETATLMANSFPHRLYIVTTPDLHYRSTLSLTISGNEHILEQDPIDQINWSLPPGAGAIVCGASSANSLLANLLTPIFEIYPSYATLRGASA